MAVEEEEEEEEDEEDEVEYAGGGGTTREPDEDDGGSANGPDCGITPAPDTDPGPDIATLCSAVHVFSHCAWNDGLREQRSEEKRGKVIWDRNTA